MQLLILNSYCTFDEAICFDRFVSFFLGVKIYLFSVDFFRRVVSKVLLLEIIHNAAKMIRTLINYFCFYYKIFQLFSSTFLQMALNF